MRACERATREENWQRQPRETKFNLLPWHPAQAFRTQTFSFSCAPDPKPKPLSCLALVLLKPQTHAICQIGEKLPQPTRERVFSASGRALAVTGRRGTVALQGSPEMPKAAAHTAQRIQTPATSSSSSSGSGWEGEWEKERERQRENEREREKGGMKRSRGGLLILRQPGTLHHCFPLLRRQSCGEGRGGTPLYTFCLIT